MTTPTAINPDRAITPTIRQATKRAGFWIILAIVLIITAVIALLVTGMANPSGVPLSSTNPSPTGSKAIAQVLRSQGVTVTASDSMAATKLTIGADRNATIFLIDDGNFLNADKLYTLESIASDLVIMTPNFDQLETIAPELALAGDVSKKLHADCDVRAVTQAKTVTGDGVGYRLIGTDSDARLCLGSGDDIYSIIQATHGQTRLTVVGTRAAFTNEFVDRNGNAALALGLLGNHRNLVWMMPAIDEAIGASGQGTAGGIIPTLGMLTPDWLPPTLLLLVLTVIAAGFWRGRRFGPLAVENLPVFVRASETMEGRARLYEKSRARLHVLDALRMGSIERLGKLCGLGSLATVDDVIVAVAALTGLPAVQVAAILRDSVPASEGSLVKLSDALLTLESTATAALRNSSTAPNHEQGE